MAEVADLARVSHQTVSRVVNGFAGVRPETRKRVEQAILDTGYRRNDAARTLVTKRSGLIGVVSAGSTLFGPVNTLVGIEEAARSSNYSTLLTTLREGSEAEFEAALGQLLDRGVEAVVVIAAHERLVGYTAGTTVGVPLVVVGPSRTDMPHLATMSVNQEHGMRLAVQHISSLRHERIILLGGPHDWIDARQRLRAATEECKNLDLDFEVIEGDWSPGCGYRVATELIARTDTLRPTALLAANDGMALGALAAFREGGWDVPDDVSVMGFDNLPESEYFQPPLTTIHQDFRALGGRVVSTLVSRLEGVATDPPPVDPTLVLRRSTAPLP
ncbi:LacI family DNA-binding transcriptional regulator [Rothia koreensis]|jgi:DNA-binding LacI/PurR family transcriptional regulator|uniref:LacI family DNA-binding transcriptional regulator n=1 Tax=Rothia koreensis TaxID=592378 RepID=UPI0037C7577B